jgi:hypothetical protein
MRLIARLLGERVHGLTITGLFDGQAILSWNMQKPILK